MIKIAHRFDDFLPRSENLMYELKRKHKQKRNANTPQQHTNGALIKME